MITFGLDLNLIPGKVLPRLNVSQYDKGQTVSVSLWNGDVPYSIPAGCTAQVVGTKADKTGFMYPCTIENGQPSFVITDQMTIFPGEVTLEVIIMDADSRIGTVNFILRVEKAALADDTQISESDMPIIQRIPEILMEVEAAEALAEAWAVGPGTEQEPSATNNAYYWAMQAASAAGGGLQPAVVQELPTQNISTSTIYFVPSADPSTSNYYDEYINLDGTSQGWELIGTTAIDLTNYYTKTEINGLLADKVSIDDNSGQGYTWAQYNALPQATKMDGKIRLVGGGVGIHAATVSYDNTVSGMDAENAQEAIDELKQTTNELNTQLKSKVLVGSAHASSTSWATITGVNTEVAGYKMLYLQATIGVSFFTIYVPVDALTSSFNPVFRVGADGCNVQFTYTHGFNNGSIQLSKFTVDGVEHNTDQNATLTVFAMN